MCNRYTLVDKKEIIELKFNARFNENYEPNYNISTGSKSWVITDNEPDKIQLFEFGLTPFFSKKLQNIVNARAEGDHNKNDDSNYHGTKGIILKPEFRKPIRSQRCLVLSSAFIINETSDKPYLIYLNTRPFAFAGIWDTWKNPATEELINSFVIITVPANSFLQKIQCKRMPVILSDHNQNYWLKKNTDLGLITGLLKPYPAENMNGYPISEDIRNTENNNKELLNPVGKRLKKDFVDKSVNTIPKRTWGHKKAMKNDDKNKLK